jgi:hypothetical protein
MARPPQSIVTQQIHSNQNIPPFFLFSRLPSPIVIGEVLGDTRPGLCIPPTRRTLPKARVAIPAFLVVLMIFLHVDKMPDSVHMSPTAFPPLASFGLDLFKPRAVEGGDRHG